MNAANAQNVAFVVALVTALVSLIKRVPALTVYVKQFGPLWAVLFGLIAAGLVSLASEGTLSWMTVLEGLMAGLSASGLYDAARSVFPK